MSEDIVQIRKQLDENDRFIGKITGEIEGLEERGKNIVEKLNEKGITKENAADKLAELNSNRHQVAQAIEDEAAEIKDLMEDV